jgi:BlaI family penicillinase repressor
MSEVSISDSEWNVMQVIWELRRATAAEVIARLTPHTGWSHRTVRTLLSRLVDKGVLAAEADGHRFVYRPLLSKSRCVREAGRSFLEKVFGGDPTELLVHFVRDAELPPAEIERLKQLLDEKLERKG